MFSRRERDFMAALVRCDGHDAVAYRELLAAFPNPTYRRKLLWGIRRKAASATEDWDLYVRAARVESKVLPVASPSGSPPLVADPLLNLMRSVQGLFRSTPRSRTSPSHRDRDSPRRVDRK